MLDSRHDNTHPPAPEHCPHLPYFCSAASTHLRPPSPLPTHVPGPACAGAWLAMPRRAAPALKAIQPCLWRAAPGAWPEYPWPGRRRHTPPQATHTAKNIKLYHDPPVFPPLFPPPLFALLLISFLAWPPPAVLFVCRAFLPAPLPKLRGAGAFSPLFKFLPLNAVFPCQSPVRSGVITSARRVCVCVWFANIAPTQQPTNQYTV